MPAATLDRAFHTLADPTRHGIHERVAHEDASISDLAKRFDMSLTRVKKHIRVLEEVGPVPTRKESNVRTVSIGPRDLDDVARRVNTYRRTPQARLDLLEVLQARMQGDDAGR